MARPCFRRAVRTIADAKGRVDAAVQDDFHHFGIVLRYRDGLITNVEGSAERYPWTTCIAAPTALAAFDGVPIDLHPLTVFPLVSARAQCTHLFELTALAIAQAARGPGARLYEVEVEDPEDGRRCATLSRDGVRRLGVQADAETFLEAGEFTGKPIRALTGRVLAEMAPDDGEMWLIMRQALRTARGRQMPLDNVSTPLDLQSTPACFTGLPENLSRARRVAGSQLDFSASPGPTTSLNTKLTTLIRGNARHD